MTDTTTSFGKAFRDARIRKGHTQTAAAAALRLTRQAVSQWETGSTRPVDANWEAVAEYMGVGTWQAVETLVAKGGE